MENQTYYSQRIELCKQQYAEANKKYRILGTIRLLAFLSILLLAFVFWGNKLIIIPCFILFVFFLFLVHRSVNTKYLRDKKKKLIEINEEELHVLNGNWLHFKEGSEYKDANHAFSHDMDIFGKKSIYQLLNRTVSKKGSDLLAAQLLNGVEDIELANYAIMDFCKQLDWCQEFIAEGMVFKDEELEKEFFKIGKISSPENVFSRILRLAIPLLSISITILFAFDLVSSTYFGLYLAVVFGLIGRNLKNANRITAEVTSFSSQVKMFQRQLALYAKVVLASEKLKSNRDALFSNKENLLQSLASLEKIQGRMDTRMNLIVGTALNLFFAWDYQILYQWEQWRLKNQDQLGIWEKQLAQIEVWISGAVYKFNFPETTFAKFTSTKSIKIINLAHPFVSRAKCVANDVLMNDFENFMIITGPNMAGKSTYLRSLGLAFISANSGFPVFASDCEIPVLKLYSSMRTTDDLTVESSYFHAELTRLRFIMDAIENGEEVFIILDEILKGTNSKDKEIGSAMFLQKLRRLNAKGIIATHDLSLCNLSAENNAFKNKFFDSTITGKELFFDYKIRDGICKNMNASFLLKQMKLVD